jgi:hypothetical protein
VWLQVGLQFVEVVEFGKEVERVDLQACKAVEA